MILLRSLEITGPEDLQVDLELPSGSVVGAVRTAEGPVPAALVILLRWDTELSIWVFHGKGDAGSDGAFLFPWLSPGRYRVSAMGLAPAQGSANAPEFELLAEATRQDISLEPGGSLTIDVLDEDGAPVQGAIVRLVDASGLELPYHPDPTTDRSGRQHLPSLAQGAWTLIVTRDGFEERSETVRILVGEETESRVTLDRTSGR
jgi:hypothetical protein